MSLSRRFAHRVARRFAAPALISVAALVWLSTETRARAADGAAPPSPNAPSRMVPPWQRPSDVPIATWIRSARPKTRDPQLFVAPGAHQGRRGTARIDARLPVFAATRGAGCVGRWLLVGPSAWICSDRVELLPDAPQIGRFSARPADGGDALHYTYYFIVAELAVVYETLESIDQDAPIGELDRGFAVAVVEERTKNGSKWGRMPNGRWIEMRDLGAAHPSTFQGVVVEGVDPKKRAPLDLAWVIAHGARSYRDSDARRASGDKLPRYSVVQPLERIRGRAGEMVRVAAEGADAVWLRAQDLEGPESSAPPQLSRRDEPWIDVDLAHQTLVAYRGERPVYATLVSTGKGPQGSDQATPKGTFRIWAKLLSTRMANIDAANDEAAGPADTDSRYSLDDVPYVQFFEGAVALHGAFWHDDFGHKRSHGCVNLAPADAAWLFDFTRPALPSAWSAALPASIDPGTIVRVR